MRGSTATDSSWNPPQSRDAAPTWVRWRILMLLMAYAGLVHFNRISISVAGTEHLMPEFAIDKTRMGFVYSAYLFIYTLCMIPGGWLIDRFGPKRAFQVLGFGSAILVPLTALSSWATSATILSVLIPIRFLLGIVSTPMHPGAARAVSFWMPYQARGMANGLVTGAAVAGVSITYFLFGYLMDLVGWPAAFVVSGIATLGLALVWTIVATDHPRQHPSVNLSEAQLIDALPAALVATISPADSIPDQAAAARHVEGHNSRATRSLILLTLSYAAVSYFQYLFFYWMQYYFDEILDLGKDVGRLCATIPTVAMAVGMIIGGWFADRVGGWFAARYAGEFGRWLGRAIAPMAGMTASAILLVVGILGQHPVWVVTCFALAMAALGASEASFWVTGIELGRRRGGLSAAILNAGGNAGGILAPVITPLFSEQFGWQAGLGLASVLCFLGATLWLWIDPFVHSAKQANTGDRAE